MLLIYTDTHRYTLMYTDLGIIMYVCQEETTAFKQ